MARGSCASSGYILKGASLNMDIYNDPSRRHDFVYLFDVTDGNPNGDPDAGNLPRVDPETMQGLVTDVAIKRKVRDWVALSRPNPPDESRDKIYVENSGIALNTKHQRAYTNLGIKSAGNKQPRGEVDLARTWMRENFYDVRAFGAVMSTGVNCGQVRGPLQLTFARSIDPIIPLDLSITRVAITKPEDAAVLVTDDGGKGGKQTEMGRKALVPYGLYRGYGFFSPHFAQGENTNGDARLGQGGAFTTGDLALFWDALRRMWDVDHSSSRGMLALRALFVFSHADPRGNAPSHQLFERVSVRRNPAVEAPRAFVDYRVTVNQEALPEGVTLTRRA